MAQLGDACINALATLDSVECRQLLLSFVDPDIAGLSYDVKLNRDDILAARLAELAHRDQTVMHKLLELCRTDLPEPKRHVLARTMASIGTPEATLGGLNLIDDGAASPVPREVWRLLEATFVEHRSIDSDSNT
jgi:hypothetical protein